jgi:hypothetical protein
VIHSLDFEKKFFFVEKVWNNYKQNLVRWKRKVKSNCEWLNELWRHNDQYFFHFNRRSSNCFLKFSKKWNLFSTYEKKNKKNISFVFEMMRCMFCVASGFCMCDRWSFSPFVHLNFIFLLFQSHVIVIVMNIKSSKWLFSDASLWIMSALWITKWNVPLAEVFCYFWASFWNCQENSSKKELFGANSYEFQRYLRITAEIYKLLEKVKIISANHFK